MRKLLPILLALVGLGGGVGAGIFLRPDPAAHSDAESCLPMDDANHAADEMPPDPNAAPPDYVKLNNQFVVPIIGNGDVRALVILSISLEVTAGGSETVYSREPRLRDAILQVLFDHANIGGFDGAFTSASNMRLLRKALLEAARKTLGDTVKDVLVIDLVRQDS
jgi:flagellar basal body-associated protein FliL